MNKPPPSSRKAAKRGLFSSRPSYSALAGTIALAGVVLTCGGTLYAHLGLDDVQVETHSFVERFAPVVTTPAVTVVAKSVAKNRNAYATPSVPQGFAAAPEARQGYGSLMSNSYSLGGPPATFEQRLRGGTDVAALPPANPAVEIPSAIMPGADEKAANGITLEVARELLQAVPLPLARPQEARLADKSTPKGPTAREIAAASKDAGIADKAADASIFEKLFGKIMPKGNVFAYAAPDGGVTSDGRDITPTIAGRYDRMTAVYDISAKAVYMPDGTKLEAHSGLGPKMDDIRHVHVKMHGPTPPHTYDLTPRERLFHGVEALRMHPVGGSAAIHGRTGLLTHSYLLGPNGDSNGCISFKEYDKFLNAYKRGEVKRIVVVAKLD